MTSKKIDEVISLTFGDQGENHIGMDKVGNMLEKGEGFNHSDLLNIKNTIEKYIDTNNIDKHIEIEIKHLNNYLENENEVNIEVAYVMIIRNAIVLFSINADDLYDEMLGFDWERKYFDTRRKSKCVFW